MIKINLRKSVRVITSLSFVLFSCFLSSSLVASESKVTLEKAAINANDHASLQRGAKYFLNFCASCHSAEYIRYSRIAKDIKITDSDTADGEIYTDLVKTNLMFNTADINDHVKSSLRKKDGEKMFGMAPPDLTMVTRVRGVDWVYTYLKSFYVDENRPWGVNNTVFKDVAMPHVLYNYQGKQELKDGELQIVEPGKFNNEQYDEMITDLTNFLAYTAEPYKADRVYLGVWVLLFLTVFLVFAYLLKREYWRDIKKKK
jgi:ubiquinol-cytochrome c reductase cytochrome c1 subunit